ncbi:MAG: WbqC family protein [Rikenellaceae bacterium]|nr:WbqC family protein [Rikenellaceae bacterium]
MNVLSLNYLGNIQYFSKLCFSECIVDIHEYYRRRSFRNRCEILSAGGRTALTASVVNPGNFSRTAVKDIRLDNTRRWRHTHWQSMVSSYKNSPYFDFYAERFEPFYDREFEFLFELNAGLLEVILDIISPGTKPLFSKRYVETCGEDNDYRGSISPLPRLMRPDTRFRDEPYWQVFSDRFAFERNLSVVDLIFCEGPGARDILKKCYVP